MYHQLRPGGVLILEAQDFKSYDRRRKLTVSTKCVAMAIEYVSPMHLCVLYLWDVLCIICDWTVTVSCYKIRSLWGDVLCSSSASPACHS